MPLASGRRSTVLLLLIVSAANARAQAVPPSTGELIYRKNVLPSGQILRGERQGGGSVSGADAACATCHRRSGLGSWEGQSVIPPIIGRYLFRPGARNVEDPELPHVQGYIPHRDPYTEVTLARAIREGKDQQGRQLSYLMPRYNLNDTTTASLIAYLKGLTNGPVPGVTADALHFATIVTPDADPTARKNMLDVLRQFFADKNAGYRGGSPPLQSTRGVMYRVNRKWQLHVWELAGGPETWEQQLRQHLAATPVFAVVSGIGGKNWAPVHSFCEHEAVPCLLPNVDLPVVAEQDFYPVYYFKGVLLEAELLARQLRDGRERLFLRRIVQVFRKGDIGEAAAKALEAAMAATGLPMVSRALNDAQGKQELVAALSDVGGNDVLVLWLRPDDLKTLANPPAPISAVYVSGLMGTLENSPLPLAWRTITHMTYPFDLPEQRKVRMNFPLIGRAHV